jgi:hypothetical protein
MYVAETPDVSGTGVVVVTDIKVVDLWSMGISLSPRARVSFYARPRVIQDRLRGRELFGAAFGPGKPLAFTLADALSKTAIPLKSL